MNKNNGYNNKSTANQIEGARLLEETLNDPITNEEMGLIIKTRLIQKFKSKSKEDIVNILRNRGFEIENDFDFYNNEVVIINNNTLSFKPLNTNKI